jgi:hypothetical protein
MPNYNDDPNMVPLMRMSPYGGYAKPTKTYAQPNNAEPLKRKLEGDQDTLPQHLQDAIKNAPTKRLKYCGGTSKPYGKKK